MSAIRALISYGCACGAEKCGHVREARLQLDALEAEYADKVWLSRDAFGDVAVPLEVLAGQIAMKPYSELSDELQAEIERAVLIVRRALLDERMKP